MSRCISHTEHVLSSKDLICANCGEPVIQEHKELLEGNKELKSLTGDVSWYLMERNIYMPIVALFVLTVICGVIDESIHHTFVWSVKNIVLFLVVAASVTCLWVINKKFNDARKKAGEYLMEWDKEKYGDPYKHIGIWASSDETMSNVLESGRENPCIRCGSKEIFPEYSSPSIFSRTIETRLKCKHCGNHTGWVEEDVEAFLQWNRENPVK